MLKASLFRRSFLLYGDCMIKAIIFDFDGVIVLSEQARFSALQKLGERYDIEIGDDLFKNIIGRTTNDFFKLNYPDLDPEKLQQLMHDYQVEYKDKVVDHVVPSHSPMSSYATARATNCLRLLLEVTPKCSTPC